MGEWSVPTYTSVAVAIVGVFCLASEYSTFEKSLQLLAVCPANNFGGILNLGVTYL
jgi:hypothetical protein